MNARYHQSYTTFSTTRVIEMATETLVWIEKNRQARKLEYALDEIESMRQSFWRRLFRTPLPSVEETLAGLEASKSDLWAIGYHFIDGYWRDEEETAERMFALAFRTESDVINVTAADFAHIGTLPKR